MSRKLATLVLLTAATALTGVLPAQADDSVKGAAMIPVRLAAFATGAAVGTPIAILRKTCENTTTMSGDISDKSTNPALRITSALVILPFACFKGGLEGAYYGVANSWSNSSEKPFSAESFSLGEMKE